MTLPSTLTIALPPTFQSSFWPSGPTHLHAGSASSSSSQASALAPPSYTTYRPPLVRLYSQLQAGIDFNSRLLALVQHRAASEYAYAEALATPTPTPSYLSPIFSAAGQQARAHSSFHALQVNVPGFAGVSSVLKVAELEGQRAEAESHGRLANLLETTILEPFTKWTKDHRERIKSSWDYVEEWLDNVELMGQEVGKLRATYENKCRAADEAEDDARFAPVDNSFIASSPSRSTSTSSVSAGNGQASHESQVSQTSSASADSEKKVDEDDDDKPVEAAVDPDKLKRRETLREQFGFDRRASRKISGGAREGSSDTAVGDDSTASLQSNGSNSSSLKRSGTLSNVLSRVEKAASTSPIVNNLRAAVSGMAEPKHVRLRKESQTAEDKYRSAVERLDRLRAELEEVIMEHLSMCQKWETERTKAVKAAISQYARAFESVARVAGGSASVQRIAQLPGAYSSTQDLATMIRVLATSSYKPLPQVFQPYYHHEITTLAGAGSEGFGMNLLVWDRARALAISDEEHVDAGAEKLPVAPKALKLLLQALADAYADEKRWPVAPPPAPVATLTKAEDSKDEEEEQKTPTATEPPSKELGKANGDKPEALDAATLKTLRYAEQRRAWIYEVPLRSVHALRFALIAALRARRPEPEILSHLLARADPPVLAALVKTWAMELEETLVPQSCWDTVWSIYRAATAQEEEALKKASEAVDPKKPDAKEGDKSAEEQLSKESAETPKVPADVLEKIEKGIVDDLKVVLTKLPKIHLSCLDAVIKHLSTLYKNTENEDGDALWLQKLAMSIGRVLLRPPSELPQTLYARHPHVMALDLIKNYDALFPPIVAVKAKESAALTNQQRRTPVRKRTRPVDMRTSRSSLAANVPPLPSSSSAGSSIAASKDTLVDEPADGPSPPQLTATSESGKPTLLTDVEKPAGNGGSEVAPTPIAERVLGGFPSKTEPENYLGVDSSIVAAIDTGDVGAGTPPSSNSPLASSAPGDANSGKEEIETAEENKKEATEPPLSNVARISRQFGAPASGSGVGGPRGPRPAGARQK